jgi:hypothetical protein
MIEKFYAAHIKNQPDTAAINVRRTKPTVRKKIAVQAEDDTELYQQTE